MPLFDFEGTDFSVIGPSFGTMVQFADGGVTFTLSMLSGAGTGNIIYSAADGGGLRLVANGTDASFLLEIDSPAGGTFAASPVLDFHAFFSGAGSVTQQGQILAIRANGGNTQDSTTLTAPLGASSIAFSISTSTIFGIGFVLQNLTTDIACFLAGTRISTPSGFVEVQELRVGDEILTAKGGRPSRVKWLGQQKISPDLLRPEQVNPICVTAGALGAGVPSRDLFLSSDHALFVEGMLVNAGALVNGGSIYQLGRMTKNFSYYHVETEAHELLLAEDCPAETYLDGTAIGSFDNEAERDGLVTVVEMDLPRITSARLLPLELTKRIARDASEKPALLACG